MRWRRKVGGSLTPPPADDRAPGDGFINAGWQNGSTDNDPTHIHQYSRRPQRTGSNTIPVPAIGYANGWETLQGPHFRVGYQSYIGVQDFAPLAMAQADAYVGPGTLIMRPPIIPRRTVQKGSVANAVLFVQSMPYQTWAPIVPPLVSRR